MRFALASVTWLVGLACFSAPAPAASQELARVSVQRPLRVAGIVMEAGQQDLIGLSRVQFQGLIAAELSGVGYRLADSEAAGSLGSGLPPLTLIGSVKEEVCDEQIPTQCRVAIQWELQDSRGVVVYRAITRAVEQAVSLEQMRRGLVEGALRSLLQRRRFPLQLSDGGKPAKPEAARLLGFKRCRRPPLALPEAARAVGASLVFVESGSNLATGTIISGDGLILTAASPLTDGAPLRVRFSAEQTLPAHVVAVARKADVALLRVAAHTDATCLAIRETVLSGGQAVFGISGEPSEDRALSLAGGVVQPSQPDEDGAILRVDSLLARAVGGALLDAQGRIAGVVLPGVARAQSGRAREALAALEALEVQPAAISDPRLLEENEAPAPVTYIRDRDDPPFVMSKRYTYGTSSVAHRLRTAGLVAAGGGAVAVASTWMSFRAARNPSPAAHQRLVVLNDVGWVMLGLGAVSVGVSFALPEGHEVVGVRSASAVRRVFVGLGPEGIAFSGSI